MSNRDELRQKMAIVIADALGEGIHYHRPGFQRAADAAIAAYEAHRPRAEVVLTREEMDEARITAGRVHSAKMYTADGISPMERAIRTAFPWIRVEDEG